MVTLLLLATSVAVSSFAGYLAHRALHKKWAGPFFKGHMEHHFVQYPSDKLISDTYLKPKWYHDGLVLFAPVAAAVLGTGGVLGYLLGLSIDGYLTFAVFTVAFGLLNDYVHNSFHVRKHWLHSFPGYSTIRELHFQHHVDMTKNFGIVTLIWDRVFKTKGE
jgi:sterol desaturase/sphingolipid hydroxylase (fatty acid hydroxylase superfamily)